MRTEIASAVTQLTTSENLWEEGASPLLATTKVERQLPAGAPSTAPAATPPSTAPHALKTTSCRMGCASSTAAPSDSTTTTAPAWAAPTTATPAVPPWPASPATPPLTSGYSAEFGVLLCPATSNQESLWLQNAPTIAPAAPRWTSAILAMKVMKPISASVSRLSPET
jgi:hypothetical protein